MKLHIEAYILERRELVNKGLSNIFSESGDGITRLDESIRYSLLGGGKRLRPILCIAGCESVGGNIDLAIPVACAIEMIHTYSLIHDDLPCMDDDLLRRGKPTNHRVFGEATSVLAGDALLTDAFAILAEVSLRDGLDSKIALEVIREISRACGSQGIIRGQAWDLALEGKDVKIDMIERIHALKTGTLIEASVVAGGRVGGGSKKEVTLLRKYARPLGLAFQIIDDVLDIEGSTEMGKHSGMDIKRKKATYPSLVGIEKAKEIARSLTEKALSALEDLDGKADPLRDIALYLIKRKR